MRNDGGSGQTEASQLASLGAREGVAGEGDAALAFPHLTLPAARSGAGESERPKGRGVAPFAVCDKPDGHLIGHGGKVAGRFFALGKLISGAAR